MTFYFSALISFKRSTSEYRRSIPVLHFVARYKIVIENEKFVRAVEFVKLGEPFVESIQFVLHERNVDDIRRLHLFFPE